MNCNIWMPLLLLCGVLSAKPCDAGWFKNPDGSRKRLHEIFGNRAEIPKRHVGPINSNQRLIRAGNPHQTARWARVPKESKFGKYFIGGGAARKGQFRSQYHEGTWGRDYTPWYSRVRLRWFHNRKQAGTGQYESDRNNKPLSNLFRR